MRSSGRSQRRLYGAVRRSGGTPQRPDTASARSSAVVVRHRGRAAAVPQRWFFFFFAFQAVFLLAASCQPEITIVSYNVYNLFDAVDDGTEYNRYDPGLGKWDAGDFELRLKAIAEVIKKVVPGGPDVIAFQEVENRAALDSLCDKYLEAMGYQYRYMAPVEGQAVGSAIISRIPIRRTFSLNPGEWAGRRQRLILEAEIEFQGRRLVLFNVHWKSKSGGVKTTEAGRIAAARVLASRVKAILTAQPSADIVVVGDFNENVAEYMDRGESYLTALMPASLVAGLSVQDHQGSVFLTSARAEAGVRNGRLVLYDCWYDFAPERWGSYVFQGQWQTPDHILLAPRLFDDIGFFQILDGFRALNSSFLLEETSGYPKFVRGTRGTVPVYSDHLPLVLTLGFSED